MSPNVIEIDNTTPNDNWLINNSGVPVTVACKEPWGSFAVHLQPGQTKRITYDVRANVFPFGDYNYDSLPYSIDKGEKWEVVKDNGNLALKKQ
jgi:hypothetical protein